MERTSQTRASNNASIYRVKPAGISTGTPQFLTRAVHSQGGYTADFMAVVQQMCAEMKTHQNCPDNSIATRLNERSVVTQPAPLPGHRSGKVTGPSPKFIRTCQQLRSALDQGQPVEISEPEFETLLSTAIQEAIIHNDFKCLEYLATVPNIKETRIFKFLHKTGSKLLKKAIESHKDRIVVWIFTHEKIGDLLKSNSRDEKEYLELACKKGDCYLLKDLLDNGCKFHPGESLDQTMDHIVDSLFLGGNAPWDFIDEVHGYKHSVSKALQQRLLDGKITQINYRHIVYFSEVIIDAFKQAVNGEFTLMEKLVDALPPGIQNQMNLVDKGLDLHLEVEAARAASRHGKSRLEAWLLQFSGVQDKLKKDGVRQLTDPEQASYLWQQAKLPVLEGDTQPTMSGIHMLQQFSRGNALFEEQMSQIRQQQKDMTAPSKLVKRESADTQPSASVSDKPSGSILQPKPLSNVVRSAAQSGSMWQPPAYLKEEFEAWKKKNTDRTSEANSTSKMKELMLQGAEASNYAVTSVLGNKLLNREQDRPVPKYTNLTYLVLPHGARGTLHSTCRQFIHIPGAYLVRTSSTKNASSAIPLVAGDKPLNASSTLVIRGLDGNKLQKASEHDLVTFSQELSSFLDQWLRNNNCPEGQCPEIILGDYICSDSNSGASRFVLANHLILNLRQCGREACVTVSCAPLLQGDSGESLSVLYTDIASKKVVEAWAGSGKWLEDSDYAAKHQLEGVRADNYSPILIQRLSYDPKTGNIFARAKHGGLPEGMITIPSQGR